VASAQFLSLKQSNCAECLGSAPVLEREILLSLSRPGALGISEKRSLKHDDGSAVIGIIYCISVRVVKSAGLLIGAEKAGQGGG